MRILSIEDKAKGIGHRRYISLTKLTKSLTKFKLTLILEYIILNYIFFISGIYLFNKEAKNRYPYDI